jgi:serine phosphatase RsbU (regulator of sigma subunit)
MEERKITIWKNTFKRRFKNELKFRIIYIGIPFGLIVGTILLVVFLNGSEEDFKGAVQLLTTLELCVLIFALNKITKSNRIIKNQKRMLEEKQKEITESIEYALRIQTAILPPQKIVKQYLENSFILYKPKNIIAGDFYWMETVNDLVLFAACDCTGHGVPGAIVSVVCNNALNRAVREFGLTQPAAILDKTAEIVIENFSKSEEDIKDGMDISLCAYNIKTKKLEWSGANNPLWLVQNGALIETKADKQPIGMNENSKPFTNHQFTLNIGDIIYLFTDGFADQFGGKIKEKKLTKKRFKEQLLAVQNLTLEEQGVTLDKFIVEYRKEIEQIDDILVMGVKV